MVSFPDPIFSNIREVKVLGDPDWTVLSYFQQAGVSMAEAMHAVVLQRGWGLNWRYWDYQGRGNPTAYDPSRGLSTHVGADYFISDLKEILQYRRLRLDRARVRNVIEGIYGENRDRLKVEDTASITANGRRYMLFSEDALGNINDAVEMGRMIEGALADQKDAGVECDYERTYFGSVELADVHHLPANPGKHPALDLAVYGYSHSLDWRVGGAFRSTIRLVNQAVAAKLRWRKLEPRMVHVSLGLPIGPAPEGAIWIPVDDLTLP